jgi:hypothetical protein
MPELARVNRWKLPTQRNRGRLAKNSDADIESVTKRALAAPEHLQLYVFQLLHGVSDAVASALLVFPFPDRHTVIDFRVRVAGQPVRLRACWPRTRRSSSASAT